MFNSNQGNLGKIARITGYLAKKLTCSNQGYLERKIIRIPANLGRSLLPLISHTVKHLLMIQTTHRHAILIFLICSFDGTHLCGLEWRFCTAVNYSHSLTRMCWVGGYAQSYAWVGYTIIQFPPKTKTFCEPSCLFRFDLPMGQPFLFLIRIAMV